MGILFVAIPTSKKDALTQRNATATSKRNRQAVRCGVLSDRQFACSAAAQHCVGSSTKQQTNKANTQQAIIIIIIDRYRY